jgi:uncharacterized OB-fold protein
LGVNPGLAVAPAVITHSATVDTSRRGPAVDEDSRLYWDALSRHEIALQHCSSCGSYRCPPLPACLVCGSTDVEWARSSGRGVIYSFVVARHPVGAIAAEELPVVFATVEIEGGCRLVTRYVTGPAPRIDADVQAGFVEHRDWTELVFRSPDGAA